MGRECVEKLCPAPPGARPRDLAARPLRDVARPVGLVGGDRAVIRYVASRTLAAVPTLFGIVVPVFLLGPLAPARPVTSIGGESGRRVTGQAAVEMRRLYGLDRPLPARFALW